MKVLLIEDDSHKAHQIAEFIRTTYLDVDLVERRSFQSGMSEIWAARPPVVLLDMTLPTFDVVEGETGGRMRNLGGREVIEEISALGIGCATIVITQFETFGQGEELQTLDQIGKHLAASFPAVYAGTVYYHPAQSGWRLSLKEKMDCLFQDIEVRK